MMCKFFDKKIEQVVSLSEVLAQELYKPMI